MIDFDSFEADHSGENTDSNRERDYPDEAADHPVPEIVCYQQTIRTSDGDGDSEVEGLMFRGEAAKQWLFAPTRVLVDLTEAR